jgi:hypothetical protein
MTVRSLSRTTNLFMLIHNSLLVRVRSSNILNLVVRMELELEFLKMEYAICVPTVTQ